MSITRFRGWRAGGAGARCGGAFGRGERRRAVLRVTRLGCPADGAGRAGPGCVLDGGTDRPLAERFQMIAVDKPEHRPLGQAARPVFDRADGRRRGWPDGPPAQRRPSSAAAHPAPGLLRDHRLPDRKVIAPVASTPDPHRIEHPDARSRYVRRDRRHVRGRPLFLDICRLHV